MKAYDIFRIFGRYNFIVRYDGELYLFNQNSKGCYVKKMKDVKEDFTIELDLLLVFNDRCGWKHKFGLLSMTEIEVSDYIGVVIFRK